MGESSSFFFSLAIHADAPKRFSDLALTNISINADWLLAYSSTLKTIRSTLLFRETLLAGALSQPP